MNNYFKFVLYQLKFFIKTLPILKKLNLTSDNDKAYEYIHDHAKQSLDAININIDVVGEENVPNVPVLFVVNHASMLDSFILISSIKRTTGCLIADEKVWSNIPIVTTWTKLINCIYIDRQDNRSSIKSIQTGAKTIMSGQSMAVFAEGDLTWVKDPNALVAPFRSGALKMAYKAKCPIVPVVIKNSKDTYKGYEPIGPITSVDVEVEFLEPVYEHLDNPSIKTITLGESIRDNMINSLTEFNVRYQ